jgi:hypothetical protein
MRLLVQGVYVENPARVSRTRLFGGSGVDARRSVTGFEELLRTRTAIQNVPRSKARTQSAVSKVCSQSS